VQTDDVHEAIHDVGRAGEIAGVFEQRQDREKNQEHRQERQDGSRSAGHSVGQECAEPLWNLR
jgi:hypothetical protein